jgi:hypothetical protein
MLEYIKDITDEEEARRLLMKLGNGLCQVEQFISEWKALQKPVVKQKVMNSSTTETVAKPPVSNKISRTK